MKKTLNCNLMNKYDKNMITKKVLVKFGMKLNIFFSCSEKISSDIYRDKYYYYSKRVVSQKSN